MTRIVLAALPVLAQAAPDYPPAPRAEVADDYFGTAVADPYRWLEDVDSAETRAWVRAQQALTDPLLQALPERAPLKARLEQLWNYERRTPPRVVAGQHFYTRNDGLQNQSVLMVEDEHGRARVVLDPNHLTADGTVALTAWEPSPDGKKLAYTLAEAGSDWETLQVLDVASGAALGEKLGRVKFSGIAWTADGSALLYSRYPEATILAASDAPATFEKLSRHQLLLHRLGTPQSADVVLHQPEDASWTAVGDLSRDGRYAYAMVARGTSNNRLYVYALDGGTPAEEPLRMLGKDFTATYEVIANRGTTLLVLTSEGAPNKQVIAVDLAKPGRSRVVVPEGKDVIQSVKRAGNQLLVNTLHDASSRLIRYSLEGRRLGAVRLPGLGAIATVEGSEHESEAYFSFSSFARPDSNYRLRLGDGRVQLAFAPKLSFEPEHYVTQQVFYPSKDGTRVPMFISYKKGLQKNGRNPTLLYGYGGFNIALTPAFSPMNLAWMDAGGIYAQANLRGGSEYGEAWHAAGTKGKKQNVFDDFAAAAHYLIGQRYTAPRHLGIHGRSNGGLLVGATLNQHPELFAAAVPGVGVMDMLRFHQFTIGGAWREDYGSSETAEGFSYLYPYSPVHNVKAGVAYPPTLTITADHDDRVVPGHSFKYAAAMQWANRDNPNPQLIRIEERGGHGAGKPVSKKIDEVADVLSFLLHYTR